MFAARNMMLARSGGVPASGLNSAMVLALSPVLWLTDTGADAGVWSDVSGNGKDWLQATAAEQPAIISAGLNGLQVRRWDGISDWMSWAAVNIRTVLFVYQRRGANVSYASLFGHDTLYGQFFYNTSAANAWLASNSLAAWLTSTWRRDDTVIDPLEVESDPLGWSVMSINTSAAIAPNQTRDRAFATRVPEMDLAEIIMFDYVLSEENRAAVQQYLGQKWGLYLDADVAAFVAASGATDTAGISALVAYLKAQSLWASTRFFPFKAAQNAGSGSTVYGLGGLSAANLTSYNSPAWGAAGLSLTGTEYLQGTLSAVNTANEALILLRCAPTLASAADAVRMVYNCLGYYRNTTPTGTGVAYMGGGSGLTSGELQTAAFVYQSDTSDPGRRLGTSQGGWAAAENHVAVYQLGNDYAQWKNKTSLALDQANGVTTATDCGPSDIGGTGGLVTIGGRPFNGVSSASGGTGVVAAYLIFAASAQPTTLQRETITDLLNAL